MARSTARKRALNTLYEADEKGQDIASLLQERIAHPGAQTPLPQYAIDLVQGVADHYSTINQTIDEHSTRWPLSRMAVVDRNILRIAVWEMLYNPEVPSKVAIDEAISLAKSLSESDSPAFIHGLLSAVERDIALQAQEEQEAAERAQSAQRIADLVESESEEEQTDAPERSAGLDQDGTPDQSNDGDERSTQQDSQPQQPLAAPESSLDEMSFEPLSAFEQLDKPVGGDESSE
ncbi:N utilization substance protein B [Bombiscardovia nodaiensis]|uniref:Transcription antitermination protein NusB n=1 Tax=Bombiscardovia nodaiensis TaxID=2932181 RepID=A0ABN6SB61_9BIFI|nr:N utilization substance protein B [Bombiscardovia nodaiensis]